MTLREWMIWHNVMHRHYTRYLGRKVIKPPFDWIVLGDIIQDTRPDVIIEIGSYEGGTALWMAHLLDAMGSTARGHRRRHHPTAHSRRAPASALDHRRRTCPAADVAARRRSLLVADVDS